MKVPTEGFPHNFCSCFDLEFVQLGVIPKTRNKFVEIVAVAESYLIITYLKIKNKISSHSEYNMFYLMEEHQ